jgi:UDP:flavonoid glycosyltransferase YjiC (YdhE family)
LEEDHITGFWFLDEVVGDDVALEDHDELLAFLGDGPPPVYVGFGSMPFPNARENLGMLQEVLKRLDQRALISKGCAGLSDEDIVDGHDRFFPLGDVPHHWLFPKVAAVIHHGGSGTVAMGLRAARPTLVCPILLDQWFWGHRVADAGVGPRPLHAQAWTPPRLERTVTDLVQTPDFRDRAEALGAAISRENGNHTAVERIRDAVGEPDEPRRPR